ncbi:MAG: 6-bladed beta-propeller [Bacteroidales bacterium]
MYFKYSNAHKRLPVIFSVLFVVFFSSCNTSNTDLNKINLVSAVSDISQVDLSNFVDEISYIPLETSESSLLGYIYKIIISDQFLYVRDNRNLHLFSRDGKYLSQVGVMGKGPGEIQFITDFCVDASSGHIFILDGNTIKIHNNHGDFMKQISIEGDNPGQVDFTDGNLLIYYYNSSGKTENSYELINLNGDIIKRFPNKYNFETDGMVHTFYTESINYFLNGDLHCREIHSDTVFTFKNNEFIPKYIFNQGHGRLSPEVRGNGRYFNENGTDYIAVSHLFETTSLLFISYWWKKQGQYIIMDKKRGDEFVFDPIIGLKNDIDGGLNFIPQFSVNQNNSEYLVMWADAFKIKGHTDGSEFKNLIPQFPEKKIQLEQLAAEINENDNPVVVLGRLKK